MLNWNVNVDIESNGLERIMSEMPVKNVRKQKQGAFGQCGILVQKVLLCGNGESRHEWGS